LKLLLYLPEWAFRFVYGKFSAYWDRERGWEHERYSRMFAGRHVLEVGGGMGYDGIKLASQAASLTWAELNAEQIRFLRRVADSFGTGNLGFELLDDPLTHRFSTRFDAFYAHGVLHHVPFEVARAQFANIDRHLEPGARVVMLMYPRERWESVGRPSFQEFGRFTDGGCPWTEWYDKEKILQLVGPGYDLREELKWGAGGIEFVNFELEKAG